MKKIALMLLAVLVVFTLVGCSKNNGVDQVQYPEKEGHLFVGWYKDEACTQLANTDSITPEKRKKLYEKFVSLDEAKNSIVFNTKGGQQIPAKYKGESFVLSELPTPTKKNFEFRGWYKTARGKTWDDLEQLTAPYEVSGNQEIYAHFVPKNQKYYNWSDDVTIKQAFIDLSSDVILNPFIYNFNHENELLSLLKTDLYRQAIDWDKAIKDGLASKPGDFSRLTKENVGKLGRTQILIGAANFPRITKSNDEENIGQNGTVDGVYNQTLASELRGTELEVEIRKDLKWETGEQITANDFVYTFLQFIDSKQKNNRALPIIGSADRTKGYKILNARDYYYQGSKIGFDAKEGTPEYNSYLPDFATKKYRVILGANNKPGYQEGTTFKDNTYIIKSTAEAFAAAGLVFDGNKQKITLDQFKLLFPGKDDTWYNPRFDKFDLHFIGGENNLYVGEYGTVFPEIKPENVGIKVKDPNNPYTVVFTFTAPTPISSVLDYINGLTLVKKDLYEKSLNKNHQSNYGTRFNRIASYGPFFLKEWSPKAKWVFNKNFDSPAALYTNYKSISYEVYSNKDLAMQAFKEGKISSISVSYDYKDSYPASNPNVKETLINFPTVVLLNPTPWDKQQAGVDALIKNVDFRKALFYGIDRIGYTNSKGGYGNKPSIMFSAIHSTQFDDDPQPFYNDGKTQEMLQQDLKINVDSLGYDANLAKECFDRAYEEWKKVSNGETKVRLIMLHSVSKQEQDIFAFFKEQLEKVFGNDKFELVGTSKTLDEVTQDVSKRLFDIHLSSVGSNAAPTNLSTQDVLSTFFLTDFYGQKFGNSSLKDFGIDKSVFEIKETEKLDLTATYNRINELKNEGKINIETADAGTLKPFYEILKNNNGYFFGDLMVIYEFMLECTSIWSGNHQGYEGETNDRNTVTRAFYKIALEQLPMIPVATRAGYSVRQSNFKTKFPAFHPAFIWGPGIAQYLTTDLDFKKF